MIVLADSMPATRHLVEVRTVGGVAANHSDQTHPLGTDYGGGDKGCTTTTVHGERVVYDSEWVQVGLADITQPSGERFEHHTVRFPAVAMGVVFDAAREHVLMAWRHRFAPDVWGWEVPGGIIDEGEEPRDAVIRELREETGYEASSVSHLITFEPAVGMLRNPNHLFLMEGIKRVSEPSEMDEGRFEWVDFRDVPELIADGKVTNSGALIGLLHVLALKP